jgi:DNA replication protein DnaC
MQNLYKNQIYPYSLSKGEGWGEETQSPKPKLMIQYHYPVIIAWLEEKGKKEFGDKFHFLEQDLPIITKLISYFLDDQATAAQLNLDLTKGILLSGPIGCGKTTLMALMRYVPRLEKKFVLKPCRDISFEFIKYGYEVIQTYSHVDHKNICFDDLGTEKNLKYFGNECNVMAEIILSRYDIFISKKIHTHITTNLSASEIETAYGNRVRSRLRQMLNLIAFDKSTKDKR